MSVRLMGGGRTSLGRFAMSVRLRRSGRADSGRFATSAWLRESGRASSGRLRSSRASCMGWSGGANWQVTLIMSIWLRRSGGAYWLSRFGIVGCLVVSGVVGRLDWFAVAGRWGGRVAGRLERLNTVDWVQPLHGVMGSPVIMIILFLVSQKALL